MVFPGETQTACGKVKETCHIEGAWGCDRALGKRRAHGSSVFCRGNSAGRRHVWCGRPHQVVPNVPSRTNRRFPGCVLAHPLGIAVCHGEAAVPVVACWACRGHAGFDVVHLMNAFGRHDFFHRT